MHQQKYLRFRKLNTFEHLLCVIPPETQLLARVPANSRLVLVLCNRASKHKSISWNLLENIRFRGYRQSMCHIRDLLSYHISSNISRYQQSVMSINSSSCVTDIKTYFRLRRL